MLTLDELTTFERTAAPVQPSAATKAGDLDPIATFERAAGPYRTLLRSARNLLRDGRTIGPDLENELREGARALGRARRRLGMLDSER